MSDHYQASNDWFQHEPGSFVAAQEFAELEKLVPIIPSGIAIQLSGPCNLRFLSAIRKNPIYYCTAQASCSITGPKVLCQFDELPFESSSISLVIIAHALEFATSPQNILQEVYRVLKPGGQLVVLGFNYWSMRSLYPNIKKYSIWTVRRWLRDMNYALIANKTFYFAKKNRWLELLGHLIMPKMGAIYLIYAQKKTVGMTPIASLNPILKTQQPVAAIRPTSRV